MGINENLESKQTYLQDEEKLDLKRYFQLAFNYKWKILIILLLTLTIAVLYALTADKHYTTTYDVYYNSSQIVDIGMDKNTHYNKPEQTYWLKTMNTNQVYQLIQDMSELTYSVAQIRSFFAIELEDEESIFTITLKVQNPEIIPILATTQVKALNTIDRNNINETFNEKLEYLRNQVEENTKKLSDIQLEILQTARKLNIDNIDNIEEIKKTYENFKQDLKYAKVELSYIQASKASTQNELIFLNDTLFEQSSFTEPLKVQLMNLQVDLARALTKYGEQHPIVKE
jgi:hypothetical protein